MTRAEAVALRVVVFFGGAILMALEVSAFRIIGRTFGTALRETTTVIAVFLTAMSLGYWAGGRIGDRWPRSHTLVAILVLAVLSLLVVPSLEAVVSPALTSSSLPLSLHALIATVVLFAIPTFILAAISPVAVRLFARSTLESGSVAGSISALSTAGSIAGSVATAFLLIDWLKSIDRTVFFLAAVTCAVSVLLPLATLARAGSWPAFRRVAIACLLTAVAGVSILAASRQKAGFGAEGRTLPGTRIVFERDSPYHHVMVVDRPRGFRDLVFNRQLQSQMVKHDPNGLGIEYTDYAHLPRMLHPRLKRVLVLGLGGGTVAKQYRAWYPDVTVDAVDVDPMVADVARDWFNVIPDERLRIHVADARVFLRRSKERWDLIYHDTYTTNEYGAAIPPHLTTREYFREVADHLNDGGFFVFHADKQRTDRFTRAVYKTLKSVFPIVFVGGDTEMIACKASRHDILETLQEQAPSIREKMPRIDRRIATVSLEPLPVHDVPLLRDDYAPVDSLLRGQ